MCLHMSSNQESHREILVTHRIDVLKIAHTATIYESVITILDSKLRALGKFDGLDVTIISSSPKTADCRVPAVRHISIEMSRKIRPLADLKSIWQLYRLLKSEKFDIVHSHTAKAGFVTAVAAKMAKIPLICHTYHGLPFFEGQNRIIHNIYRFFEKVACKCRDYIFTQNKKDLPDCVKLIADKSRVILEGNGVDIELINKSVKEQLPQALKDYPGEGTRLILLSRLEPVKRVDDFFKVVDKLKRKGLKISCVVAGTGVLEKQLRNQLVKMQLCDCVNMVGFSERPHGLIAASDIVVLCSEKEGIPRTIMEAMALARPVVATDVSGTNELVVEGQTGFLVPLGDIDAMAEKIMLSIENPNLREKMGSYGLKRVSKEFNEIKIAEFLHKFYISHAYKNT